MPPKKQKGKKKKQDDAELQLEENYKRTVEEIDALKDQLIVKKEARMKTQSAMDSCRVQLKEAQDDLRANKEDNKMANANMTRQYKMMQSEMTVRVHNLEKDLQQTKDKLVKSEVQLKTTQDEKEALIREKEKTALYFDQKMNNMERAFENVLHEALDRLLENMGGVQKAWEDMSQSIQAKNKEQLLEFGLNPLEI